MKLKINIKENIGLCGKCKYSHVIERGNKTSVRCNQLDAFIGERITSCTRFYDANLSTVSEMEELAWLLKTNDKNKVGFDPERGREVKFEPPAETKRFPWDD